MIFLKSCALAYQDDWDYWNQNGEKIDFSKPLIIDQSDYSTLQIFFDDNITEFQIFIEMIFDINFFFLVMIIALLMSLMWWMAQKSHLKKPSTNI